MSDSKNDGFIHSVFLFSVKAGFNLEVKHAGKRFPQGLGNPGIFFGTIIEPSLDHWYFFRTPLHISSTDP